jgi:hypothetical protein
VGRPEAIGVEHLREQLDGREQARARAVEMEVAVGDVHAAVADGAQGGEAGERGQGGHLGPGAIHGPAARGHHQDLRVGLNHRLPRDRTRVFAGTREQRLAAGQIHQLRAPVAHGERRLDPLQADHGHPSQPGGLLAPGFHLISQAGHQRLARRAPADHLGHRDEVRQDTRQRAAAEGRHPLPRPPADRARADRAHLAVGLGDDDVRIQRRQRRLVDLVQRLARAQLRPHPRVHLRAAAVDREGGP